MQYYRNLKFVLYIYHFTLEPYIFHEGCEAGSICDDGKTCTAVDKCTSCSFGECVQHAKEFEDILMAGFAYNSQKDTCRMCTEEQLNSLETSPGWGLYTVKGRLFRFCFYIFINMHFQFIQLITII